jgi:hypothetical protein
VAQKNPLIETSINNIAFLFGKSNQKCATKRKKTKKLKNLKKVLAKCG